MAESKITLARRELETTLMQLNPSDKINNCLARIVDLRSRADAETNPARKAELRVYAAIEHADGKARAGFYLADAAGTELHHVTGMTDA
jgi:hypothetical protein